ncbi:hypothetical protein D3C86_1923230 [compost metagenome]
MGLCSHAVFAGSGHVFYDVLDTQIPQRSARSGLSGDWKSVLGAVSRAGHIQCSGRIYFGQAR